MKIKREFQKTEDDINVYLEDKEYTANTYVMKCFTTTMILYLIVVVLTYLGIFIVDKRLVLGGFLPSAVIFLIVSSLIMGRQVQDSKETVILADG